MHEHFDDDKDHDKTVATARDWVVRLASSDLTPGEMRRFKAWLSQSPSHQEAFEKERLFWQRLGGLKATAGPETWDEPSSETAHRPVARSSFRVRRRAVLAGGLAVAFFAVFGGEVSVSLMADHRTAVGERKTVTLPDGSVAYLNTGTAMAVAYADSERRIDLLQGEALFEVAADPAKPFRVEAADGITQAVGTAFVVRVGNDETTITVTKGRVSVASPGNAGDPRDTVLAEQGQRTSYRRGQAPRSAEAVDIATAALWRQGLIQIDDLPLDAAIAELDRYRPGRIVLMGSGTAYRSVSGAFHVDNIDAAIAGLAATHGLEATEITRYLLILR